MGADRRWREGGGMFREESETYEYAKDGPLSQSRVSAAGKNQPKDVLAAYDEIFAWGGNDSKGEDAVEPVVDATVDSSSGQDEVEMAVTTDTSQTEAATPLEHSGNEKSVENDSAVLDFLAELRKARERVTSEEVNPKADGDSTGDPQPGTTVDSNNDIRAEPNKGATPPTAATAIVPTALTTNTTISDCPPSTSLPVPATAAPPTEVVVARKPARRRHIKHMSVLSVCQTLKAMGLPYVAKMFEEYAIDGAVAQFLDDDLLRNQLKILTVAERKRTMEWISQFH